MMPVYLKAIDQEEALPVELSAALIEWSDVLPGMNSRASLASGDSPKAQRLTSETENVPCRIDITVMDRSAWAGPLSYTKATQSTRTCLLQTDRASDCGISLISLGVPPLQTC